MDGGIVVAVETKWEKGSSLRGGRYIWIYNPAEHFLTYYAHNEAVFVRLGDAVKPGDRIATVGRTGLNAYRRGSVTHLHLMHWMSKTGGPGPLTVSACFYLRFHNGREQREETGVKASGRNLFPWRERADGFPGSSCLINKCYRKEGLGGIKACHFQKI